jgi:K+-sensing histidine kinase KdpD
MGISENYLKVIFERFRRIEGDATLDLSGLGLGLSITKAYVEMLVERSKCLPLDWDLYLHLPFH